MAETRKPKTAKRPIRDDEKVHAVLATLEADLEMADQTRAKLETIHGIMITTQTALDSMSEMSETQSIRMQMMMDRVSKMMSTLSNLLKKISDTANSITQNLK